MLIALLAVLGVDLIVIIAFVAGVLARRRWLKAQPGDFQGAIRVADGEVKGLKPKWKRGNGRWVSNVLCWSKAPFLFRPELVPIDGCAGERAAEPSELKRKRLGDSPVVVDLTTGGATIEIATKEEDRALAVGPLTRPSSTRVPNGTAPLPPPARSEDPLHETPAAEK
jgi:hypothetical protein